MRLAVIFQNVCLKMYEIAREKEVTSYDDVWDVLARFMLAAAECQSDLISFEARFVSFLYKGKQFVLQRIGTSYEMQRCLRSTFIIRSF